MISKRLVDNYFKRTKFTFSMRYPDEQQENKLYRISRCALLKDFNEYLKENGVNPNDFANDYLVDFYIKKTENNGELVFSVTAKAYEVG